MSAPSMESAEAFAVAHIEDAMTALAHLVDDEHLIVVRDLLTAMDADAYMQGMLHGFSDAAAMIGGAS